MAWQKIDDKTLKNDSWDVIDTEKNTLTTPNWKAINITPQTDKTVQQWVDEYLKVLNS